jgi:hypothetical protein
MSTVARDFAMDSLGTLQKFYMVVNLVEMTSVEDLVDKVKKGKFKSSSEIIAKKRRNRYLSCGHCKLISHRRGDCHIRR